MKVPVVKPRELIRVLVKIGCIQKRQTGSHVIFEYPKNRVLIIVPQHPRDLKKGVLRGIIKDLNLTVEEFKNLL